MAQRPGAGPAHLLAALGRGAEFPLIDIAGIATLLGFASIGLSLVLFILSLRHLGSARAGAYFSLAPFIGALLAVLVFGEQVTARLILAGLLMAAGLWLHLAERHDHEHLHEAMEHEHRHVHDEHHQHVRGLGAPPGELHSPRHRHEAFRHRHAHYPDLHHRHGHE